MTLITDFFSSLTVFKSIDLLLTLAFILGLGLILLRARLQVVVTTLVFVGALWVVAGLFQLTYFSSLLVWLFPSIAVALIVIFQIDLKRFVDRFRFAQQNHQMALDTMPMLVKKLLTSVDLLCKEKLGALVVIEGNHALDEYIDTGIEINGSISSDLLISLFWKGSPTHDGAVILRSDRIVAAGCFLPLTDSVTLDSRLGTRHMAAIGLSERSDAFIIVVSEETGTISIVENGTITRYLNRQSLETKLFELFSRVYKADLNK